MWNVVYVASRQEKKVAMQLGKDNINHFLPVFKKLRQWSDRKKWVELPLFSGYIFVNITPVQRDKVLQVAGALAYVRYNGADAEVKQKEIDTIQTLLQSGYALESVTVPDDYEKGEKVMVTEGPLIGKVGEIIRKNKKKAFLISFETLGQSIKVELPHQILRKQK